MDPSTFEVRAQRAFPACHVLIHLSGEGRCDPPRSRLHAADDGEADEGHVWWLEDACRARACAVHQAPSPPPRRADQPSRSRRRRLARSIPLQLQPYPRHHLPLSGKQSFAPDPPNQSSSPSRPCPSCDRGSPSFYALPHRPPLQRIICLLTRSRRTSWTPSARTSWTSP